MRSERGQGTVEYLAVVLLVAGVMAAAIAVLAVTGLGEQVLREFRHGLCIVSGGVCDEAAKLATGPCVLGSRRHSDGGYINAMIVRIGSRSVVLREQLADGTVALTLLDEQQGGVDAGTGVAAHVRWGSHSWAVGSELRLAVLAERGSGRTWIARDDADASRILDQVRLAALSKRPEVTIQPTDYYSPYPPMRAEVHAPDPDVTFSERGSDLELELQAGVRRAVHLSKQDAYGERLDHVTGRRTVYVRDVVEGDGHVSFARFSAAGQAQDEERYAVTFDPSGRPVDLMVLSALDVGGAVGLPPRLSRIAGWLQIPLHGEKHVETEQHLDLTDPGNAEVVQTFLGQLGDGRLGVRLATVALRERLQHDGTLSVRTYATDAQAHQVGGHVKVLGLGVGGEAGSEDDSARLVAAVARRPDGTWGGDPACVPA